MNRQLSSRECSQLLAIGGLRCYVQNNVSFDEDGRHLCQFQVWTIKKEMHK